MPAAVLLVSALLMIAGAAVTDRAVALPSATRGDSLAQCVERLNRQGSGWCEMGKPMSAVWSAFPGKESRAILIAWNGMAIDREARKIYFVANGGHADWYGNGTYEFDLETATWRVLLPDAPLSMTYCYDVPIGRGEGRCDGIPGPPPYGTTGGGGAGRAPVIIPKVEDGPAAAHTYDGVLFSRRTRTIFYTPGIYGNPGPEFYDKGELWELNPSETETRNGLGPLKWRLYPGINLPGKTPTTAELPNGELLMGGGGYMSRFDPLDPAGTIGRHSATRVGADWGGGNVVYDLKRNVVWFFATYRPRLFRLGLDRSHVNLGEPPGAGQGMAMRNGNIVLWNGRALIHEYDPDSNSWLMWDWGGKRPGRGDSRVYSKWAYLPDLDVFVGLTDETTGVLVYKHPPTGGIPVTPP